MTDEDILTRAGAIPVSTWSDALDYFDIWGVVQGMTLQSGSGRICGFATTARQVPGKLHEFEKAEFAVGRIVSAAAPGRVLMVDVGGQPISTMGGLAAYGTKQLGAAGVVIDGACRDVDEIRKTGLWLASRHVAPTTGKGRLRLMPLGCPVEIGGITVHQDDLVVGDETGVVVVPRAKVEEILPKAEALMAADLAVEERMHQGQTFAEAGRATGYLSPKG
ncbi:RraA family protein [Rhodovarius crocodyli]|uniref:Putative 4-hydroxy-4-methyl-2-oxoglutarate aldolase n=1 Tax=Rhodovarius crocodyli TaxID=1979269 RepID=A0A437MJF7_9PROT|nr:RraA family protein [Rhodovarius crocodyli]RVT97782.1 RraA family protein [Rhodovarius crocodyli]